MNASYVLFRLAAFVMELTFAVLVNVNYFILKMNYSYHPAAGYVVSNRRLSCFVFLLFY